MRLRVAVLAVVLAAVTSVGCSSMDVGSLPAESPIPTPDPTQDPSLPPGWTHFEVAGFTGAAPSGWARTFVDASELRANSERLRDANVSMLEAWRKALEIGAINGLFVVTLASGYASLLTIAVFPCVKSLAPRPTAEDHIAALEAAGLKAVGVGFITYAGSDAPLVRITSVRGLDQYQTLVDAGFGCYSAITLGVRPNDYSQIDDFKQFVSLLSIPR